MDYQKVGLVCGLEIHQQVETAKLFCHCPSTLMDGTPGFTLLRELRAVAGESGDVDVAALHEQRKGKFFQYEGFRDATCLVETDEEPPQPVNPESLVVALQVCKLLHARVPDVIQVMRKTVVDGSNTSGFQRTALVGRNGSLLTSQGKVSIANVSLEEDSARIMHEDQGIKVYRLDRLGIPLIEIGTGPDIRTPQQCKEAAEKLGMILRSTGRVKRGLGTIRQDVNVSIKGGSRVEIKGAQDLKLLPELVDNEVIRQQHLLEVTEHLRKGKYEVSADYQEVAGVFKNSSSRLFQQGLKSGIFALRLPGLAGWIGQEPKPGLEGLRLGKELSSYAQAAAPVKGIIHSDEISKFGVSPAEVEALRKELGCASADAFALCIAPKDVAINALAGVLLRVQLAARGVPLEVRRANPDGTTTFMRPLPGAARLYPETDVPFITPPDLASIALPELLEEKEQRFVRQYGLGVDLAAFVARSDKVELFEELVRKHSKIKPAYIAEVLTSMVRELAHRYHIDPERVRADNIRQLFVLLDQGKIHKDVMLDALLDMAQGEFSTEVFASYKTEDLHQELLQVVKGNPGAPLGALMGHAMKRLKGKASGEQVSAMLKEILAGHGPGQEQKPITSPFKEGKKK